MTKNFNFTEDCRKVFSALRCFGQKIKKSGYTQQVKNCTCAKLYVTKNKSVETESSRKYSVTCTKTMCTCSVS